MVKLEVSISRGFETVPGCDRRTDLQTELPWIICAVAMLAVACKNSLNHLTSKS